MGDWRATAANDARVFQASGGSAAAHTRGRTGTGTATQHASHAATHSHAENYYSSAIRRYGAQLSR